MSHQDLHFSLYSNNTGDNNYQIVMEKTEETKLIAGKATAKFDTEDLNPGEYFLVVKFEGYSGILTDFNHVKPRQPLQ